MEIPFETNVSVPKGDYEKGVMRQFFFRDPDGYYIELCNCDILTEYCLGKTVNTIEGYEEGIKNGAAMMSSITKLLKKSNLAKQRKVSAEEHEVVVSEFEKLDGSGVIVDETKLANLVKRLKVYGDVVQGESEESLREILKKANNDVPLVIGYLKSKHFGSQVYQPPTIYKNNKEAFKPDLISITKEE